MADTPAHLLQLAEPRNYNFRGLVYDSNLQAQAFGRFAKTEAVVPFLSRHGGTAIFDPRFAPFVPTSYTYESHILGQVGDLMLLETAATGKSRAMLDVGRRYHMIYVKCDPPASEQSFGTRATASEITATGDALFPTLIRKIELNCLAEPTNEAFIENARGYILADICARLYFMYWMVKHCPEDSHVTPEQLLVAQLNGGREIMSTFFEYLCRYLAATLRKLAKRFRTILPPQYSPPRWAVDEAQVAARWFGVGSPRYFESSTGHQARSLLREYWQVRESEDTLINDFLGEDETACARLINERNAMDLARSRGESPQTFIVNELGKAIDKF